VPKSATVAITKSSSVMPHPHVHATAATSATTGMIMNAITRDCSSTDLRPSTRGMVVGGSDATVDIRHLSRLGGGSGHVRMRCATGAAAEGHDIATAARGAAA